MDRGAGRATVPGVAESQKCLSKAQHSIATPSGTILKSTLKMPCSIVDFLAQKDLRSPAQVGCMRQVLGSGALGRPRGIRWRGRWEGGGSGQEYM